MRKVDCIMLVDDDEATNFYHKIIIEEAECCEELIIFEDPIEALAYLKKADSKKPDLIFLDINMPQMTGWEFLDTYTQNSNNETSDVIILVSASMNPKDKERADEIKAIKCYVNKPLSLEFLQSLL